jgi:hypothetical protein
MPRARLFILNLGDLNLSLKTFKIVERERASILQNGEVKCLGEACSANGTYTVLEAEHPDAKELYNALKGVKVVKIVIEVEGLPRQLLSRLELLIGSTISDNATVKYTWHSMPSFEELALALNDLNLPTHPQSNPQPHP